MKKEGRQQLVGVLPFPVILGSALNAYGLVRSFGEKGINSIVADARFGMASASRYVFQKWRLPTAGPTDASIEALLKYATALNRPLVLVPTNEAWVAAIANRREEFEGQFYVPLPSAETTMMAISKDLMHSWCLKNDIRVPDTMVFQPSQDWQAFIRSAEPYLPVIVKPQRKRIDERDEEIGFSTRVFWTIEDLEYWGGSFGSHGPKSCILYQRFLSGPVTNIVAFHGYRSIYGRIFMAGLTKLRIQPPICGGSTSAAYMRADEEATRAAQDLLEKLHYQGFFDLEFMRDGGDGQLYFIELNPRPGLPNYGATAVGVNFAWEGCADQVGKGAAESRVVDKSNHLWIRLFADFFLYVIVYRAMGLGIRPSDWWRSIRNCRWVDTSLNFRDPLVIFAGAGELGLSAINRSKRFLKASMAVP